MQAAVASCMWLLWPPVFLAARVLLQHRQLPLQAAMQPPMSASHWPVARCPASGGELLADSSLLEMYETGNGSVTMRAKVHIEGEGSGGRSRGGKSSKSSRSKKSSPTAGVAR